MQEGIEPAGREAVLELKKVFSVVGIVLAVSAVVASVIVLRSRAMADDMATAVEGIEEVDLSGIEDGSYEGSFGDFLVHAAVEVTVEQARIVSVEVVDLEATPGYRALETTERIEAAQTPRVEAVSGATWSSHAIMVATYRALQAAR